MKKSNIINGLEVLRDGFVTDEEVLEIKNWQNYCRHVLDNLHPSQKTYLSNWESLEDDNKPHTIMESIRRIERWDYTQKKN